MAFSLRYTKERNRFSRAQSYAPIMSLTSWSTPSVDFMLPHISTTSPSKLYDKLFTLFYTYISFVYLSQKQFISNLIRKSTEMIENIRQEFIHILRESDWLDDESRELAIAKVFFSYTFIY